MNGTRNKSVKVGSTYYSYNYSTALVVICRTFRGINLNVQFSYYGSIVELNEYSVVFRLVNIIKHNCAVYKCEAKKVSYQKQTQGHTEVLYK